MVQTWLNMFKLHTTHIRLGIELNFVSYELIMNSKKKVTDSEVQFLLYYVLASITKKKGEIERQIGSRSFLYLVLVIE